MRYCPSLLALRLGVFRSVFRSAFGSVFGLALLGMPSNVFAAPSIRPNVVRSYPHDRRAFTEGFVRQGADVLESTGLEGASSVRRVELSTGKVLRNKALAASEFGEGLALAGERLIQLTWRNGIAHVYDATSFEERERFEYAGEGWGLCYDGTRLIMSDGTDRLFFRDPLSFELRGSVFVRDEGSPVVNLNELECVGGEVYANIWLSNLIVRIDVASGAVLTRFDASGLLSAAEAVGVDVLNGIAFDQASGHFLLTGKLWPRVFEVELPSASTVPSAERKATASCAVSPSAPPSASSSACGLSLWALAACGLARRWCVRRSARASSDAPPELACRQLQRFGGALRQAARTDV
jgi:glutaminyl-peptide cyclotransferase